MIWKQAKQIFSRRGLGVFTSMIPLNIIPTASAHDSMAS